MASEFLRLHGVMRGRVQGVFFRAFTREQAQELGLRGWVRNREDGSVEFDAEGSKAVLEEFAARCRRGPPASHVEHLELTWLPAEHCFQDFQILR